MNYSQILNWIKAHETQIFYYKECSQAGKISNTRCFSAREAPLGPKAKWASEGVLSNSETVLNIYKHLHEFM